MLLEVLSFRVERKRRRIWTVLQSQAERRSHLRLQLREVPECAEQPGLEERERARRKVVQLVSESVEERPYFER